MAAKVLMLNSPFERLQFWQWQLNDIKYYKVETSSTNVKRFILKGGDNVDIRWRTEAGWAYQVYGIGYGYSKSGIQNMAKDYAESLEKDVK